MSESSSTKEPLGAFRQVQLRLPLDLRDRFESQLRRIATVNEISFPEKINDKGQSVSHTIECLTQLLERTHECDLRMCSGKRCKGCGACRNHCDCELFE